MNNQKTRLELRRAFYFRIDFKNENRKDDAVCGKSGLSVWVT